MALAEKVLIVMVVGFVSILGLAFAYEAFGVTSSTVNGLILAWLLLILAGIPIYRKAKVEQFVANRL